MYCYKISQHDGMIKCGKYSSNVNNNKMSILVLGWFKNTGRTTVQIQLR